ncbi:MAG: methionyl-tRNA formyltransferase [Victivallales bacterium]|nr:methionyl-tRNA formyltransferase [Victivallales bacterium]
MPMPQTSEHIKVYFLSSGRLGIHLLDALLRDKRIDLVGVGSQPDKPSGRKQIPKPTPLAAHAEKKKCKVDKQDKVNDPAFIDYLRSLNMDFLVVASFGQLLKPALLEIPKYCCFNVHASLLPKYRGASPISAAILAGESYSGVSFMKMDPGLDTGPVYCQIQIPIADDDNTDTLEEKLGKFAAESICDNLQLIKEGYMCAVAQDNSRATYAGKIKKCDGAVKWGIPATQLECKIRAYTPWPRVCMLAPTSKGIKRLQITSAKVVKLPAPCPQPGTLLAQDASGITIACAQDAIKICSIIPEGRNEMSAADFLRGTQIPPNTIFTDYPVESTPT